MTLKRSRWMSRGKLPMRQMSEKRMARLVAAGQYPTSTFAPKRPEPAVPAAKRKTLAERSGGWCEARLDDCLGIATDPHHRITRKDRKVGLAKDRSDRLSSLLHTCRLCHGWIHAHPAASRSVGLLLREHQVPPQEPVLYRGEPSYLDDFGAVWSAEEVGA